MNLIKTFIKEKEMNKPKKEETKVTNEATTVKKSKNHPNGYDFSKVGALETLRVSRNGKDKKPAAQLMELIKFVKTNNIGSISRKDFYDKVNVINQQKENSKEQLKMREMYPQLEKSVQTIQAVNNFYWVRGDIKQLGVVAINA